MAKVETTGYAGITDDQIKEWKAAHPLGIKVIFIPDDEDDLSDDAPGATFVITPYNRKVLKAITKYAGDKDYQKITDLMIKNCVLGGDMDQLNDEDDTTVYSAVLEEIGKINKKKNARVKKR
jgi:hypothetical protein